MRKKLQETDHPVRQTRIIVGVAIFALVGLIAAVGIQLASTQRDQRRDIEDRFGDRAQISATMTYALFASATGAGAETNARRYGARRVTTEQMAAVQRSGGNTYLVLMAAGGTVLATSPGVAPAVVRELGARPAYVRQALGSAGFGLSNVLRHGTSPAALDFASSFNTRYGRRVIVTGLSPPLIGQFLAGYVSEVPTVKGGRAYVLDGRGAVIASTGRAGRPGERLDEPELLAALAEGEDQGSYGDGRWFAESPVKSSPWRVVSTAPKDRLFATVSGADKWVPWLVLFAFALAAVAALVLLIRVLSSAKELAGANQRLGLANRALEDQATELVRSNAELDQFAAVASHDLQEPLRKLETFAERLDSTEADRLSDKGRDYVTRMGSAAARMRSLIEDLLRFSRVSSHEHPFADVDLSKVVREVVADMQVVIDEAEATVTIGDLPTVSADPLQMHQLFQNLLSNALKFRRPGVSPEVTIAGRASTPFAEIDVIDNGIGFEPAYNTRIFNVFERLHGSAAYPGTGIGLALCHKVVERHGGTIVAEGTPGKGAKFTVTLPVVRVEESGPTTPPARPPGDPPVEAAPESDLVRS
jgi:signal transduction histidine kinase